MSYRSPLRIVAAITLLLKTFCADQPTKRRIVCDHGADLLCDQGDRPPLFLIMPSFDVLPLRAVLFQLLFLVTAIALESMVLRNRLEIGRKTSIQFAATTNLLSTVIGWMLFFIAEPLLSPELRSQLISYIFFDLTTNPPLLIGLAFVSFIATFLVKLEGITWLELLLGIRKDVETEARSAAKFQGRRGQRAAFTDVPNRPLAVLWANAISFSAITLLIGVRLLFDQTFGTL